MAARAWAFSARATVSTLLTPSIFAASAATASGASDRTMTSMDSGLTAAAALTARAVAPLSLPSRCSAMTRILDMRILRSAALQQALLLEGRDELGGVLHHHTLAALGRGGVVGGLDVVGGIDAQRTQLDHVDRLGLGLHDVRQLDEARLVQAQIGGDDGRKVGFDGLEAGVDFAGYRGLAVGDLHLASEGGLGAIPQGSQHVAGLIGVV